MHLCRAEEGEMPVCLPWLPNQQHVNHLQVAHNSTSTEKRETFPYPSSSLRSPLKNEMPLQRVRFSAGGLTDSGWFMLELANAFAKTLLHGVYLSDLFLNRQPIAAHRKKMGPPCREVAFGWAAGILVLLRIWSLRPALAALQLVSTHPGVVRRRQVSWGWVDEVDSEVAYRFDKTQIYVTWGPKESLEVPSAIRSLFIQQAVLTPGPGWGWGGGRTVVSEGDTGLCKAKWGLTCSVEEDFFL